MFVYSGEKLLSETLQRNGSTSHRGKRARRKFKTTLDANLNTDSGHLIQSPQTQVDVRTSTRSDRVNMASPRSQVKSAVTSNQLRAEITTFKNTISNQSQSFSSGLNVFDVRKSRKKVEFDVQRLHHKVSSMQVEEERGFLLILENRKKTV